MDYSQFFNMLPEATLMAVLVIVFLADLILKGDKKHATLSLLAGILLAAQTAVCFIAPAASAFSGLYEATSASNVMKVILTAGAFIVLVMSQSWIDRADVRNKEGEFYELLVSTLLGMYIMISSGHFLMFFLGLEMASVPMACLVAFDKFKKNSAEGAAKFILTATFSSGVMLYGISFLYGAVGTLYFDDVAARISASPLTIMGLVFFFSGLGSEVPRYLSRATLSSMRWIIFRVVSTPTSLVISTSSRLSSTSSSTFDLPATARVSLSSTLVLVFSRPLSSVAFLFLLKKPKIPIQDVLCKITEKDWFHGVMWQ